MSKIRDRQDGAQLGFALLTADERGAEVEALDATTGATTADLVAERLASLRDRLRARGGAG